MVLRKSCRVWRKYKPRSVLLESKDVGDHVLLFESDVIAILSPLEADILKKEAYSDPVSAYGALGVLVLEHDQVTVRYLVLVTDCQSVGKLKDVEVFKITQAMFMPLSNKAKMELVQDVGKLLASGRFFFAHPSFGATFDLLSCAQKQGLEQLHFFWNKSLVTYLQRFGVDTSKWLFRTMCGDVHIQTAYAGDKQTKLCLFSRLSCERAGTRFNVRGINDDGHVANFVETEQAIYVDDDVASFVQIRGLVPLFWNQPGIQTGGGLTRIKFSRGYNCSHPVFERHFEWCLLQYGPTLCLNLLGSRDFEVTLTNAFQEHLNQLSPAYCCEMKCFDYHRICRGTSNVEMNLAKFLLPEVEGFKNLHGFYVYCNGQAGGQQTAIMRTNCLDCLDRSNSVQSFLGQQTIQAQLSSLGLSTKQSVVARFKQVLSSAWFRNGDSLSRLYSGTGALKFEGGKNKLKDGARSVQRTIHSNFMDSNKQEAIDMLLLGNTYHGELGLKSKALLDKKDWMAPIPFKRKLCDKWSDYTLPEKLRVAVGTWNVNGGTRIRSIALKHESLSDWLLDGPTITGAIKEHPHEFSSPPDVYVVGFEEMVGLTASNIVSASSSNRKEWGVELQRVLSRDQPYELLTAEQMVGVCLYVFINPKFIPYIRDVAVSTVKTGLSGKTGNKGGVAIRFLLHSTTFCFVCSHFAAHQTKILERNQDFADICRKVSFPHGQTVDTHDYVFWCGDLNYRIELPTMLAKECIIKNNWDKLYRHDQLYRQKKLRKIFQGYIEGELNFAPTYKYDEFSDDYDTSEKCRTPAWCDRVLWKRKSWATNETNNKKLYYQHYAESKDNSPAGKSPYDFGPHPSDAGVMCQREMITGCGDDLITLGHQWHPGRLIYYNRAELKQSDHRPVLAIIEVDMYRVDVSKRSRVREEVLLALGPPDPTIIVEESGDGRPLSIQDLMEHLQRYGEIVLVRVTHNSTMVTFKASSSALAATALHGMEVNGVTLKVSLNSPWPPGSTEARASVRLRAEQSEGSYHHRPLAVLTSEKLMAGHNVTPEIEIEEQDTNMEFTLSDADECSRLPEELREGEEELKEEEEGSDGGTRLEDKNHNSEIGDLEDHTHHPNINSSSSSENEDGSEERIVSKSNVPSPPCVPVRPPRPSTSNDPQQRLNGGTSPSPSRLRTSSPNTTSRPPPPRPVPPRPPQAKPTNSPNLAAHNIISNTPDASRLSPGGSPNTSMPRGANLGRPPPPRPTRPPPPKR